MTTDDFNKANKRFLIVTAVEAERDAVIKGLDSDPRFDVIVGGVGQVATAISTTKALLHSKYDLVISAGIAGGFANKAEVSSIVVSDEIIAADLGVETSEGFQSIDDLGFGGSSRIAVDPDLVKKVVTAYENAALPVCQGPLLTLSTVTGTKETAASLVNRVPNATAEAMEGYGVALAAHECGVPCLEIRTISNPVGPRDRQAWKIKEALERLQSASKILAEVLS